MIRAQAPDRHDYVLTGLGALLIAIVAIADRPPLADALVFLAYGLPVLLGLAARGALVTLALATLATAVSFAMAITLPQGSVETVIIGERLASFLAIWILAALVVLARRRPPRSAAAPAAETGEAAGDGIYRAVFDQTFQFVAVLDTDGNIVEANETLCDYAGLSRREIRSTPVWLLPVFQKDGDVETRLRSLVKEAARGNFRRDEFVVAGVGGRDTHIDLSLKPIRSEKGAIAQIIMEARDVTEGRVQQEMLIQAQKMEALGELTAGVAHDFNNLLTAIVGNLEIIEKRIEGDEKIRERLQRAIDSVFRGQALTEQLLAFSRRQSLSPSVIDVNVMLRGMSELFESLSDAMRVEFALSDDLPPCEVDPTFLETALLNIAINARDAMPDGGRLRFETGIVSFEEEYHGAITDLPAGDYICIAVTDMGSGIPEEILPQVFEPFFTTKSQGHGTGQGLSMVYGFVKQSGGDVKIYSEMGAGTTVRIYLPTTDKPLPEAPEAEEPRAASGAARGKNVLVVEDDSAARDVVVSALSALGCRVEAAPDGDAAIALIRAGNRYDLVFTDMVMTGETGGPDVARAARAIWPGVPVIFCSGFPRQNLDGEEPSVEGALFLSKPFHHNDLIAVVERAFAREGISEKGV